MIRAVRHGLLPQISTFVTRGRCGTGRSPDEVATLAPMVPALLPACGSGGRGDGEDSGYWLPDMAPTALQFLRHDGFERKAWGGWRHGAAQNNP